MKGCDYAETPAWERVAVVPCTAKGMIKGQACILGPQTVNSHAIELSVLAGDLGRSVLPALTGIEARVASIIRMPAGLNPAAAQLNATA